MPVNPQQIQMHAADVSDHLHSPGPTAEPAEGPASEGIGRNVVASLFSSCKKPSVALLASVSSSL